ncbi:MAG: ABC transporter substrate-binding protein [Deltaproteobacteria bacterium]|nr:ABC transporter substrate-binding protein [Deltaproteobacteria bacterium]
MDIYRGAKNKLPSNAGVKLRQKQGGGNMRSRRTIFFFGIVSAVFATLTTKVWAVADSPTETVRTTIQQARAVLEDPSYQGQEHKRQRLEKVREVVLPQFDSQEVAKRTLSTYWKSLSEQQRQEFIQLFISLVERTYAHNLDRYSKNVQFFYDQERVEENFSEVDTRVLDPAQNRTFSIGYRLRNVNGKWLVYDVVIENVSMVQNYRNQFNRILAKSSYEDLIKALQNKIYELENSPTPDKKS